MEKFLSRDDLHMRLHGCLCMYNGEPVKVEVGDFKKDTDITVLYLDAKKKKEVVDYTSDGFTASGIKLGYVNYEGSAYYTARIPVRRNQLGINLNNTNAKGELILFSKQMRNTILGKYPPLSDAIKAIASDKVVKMAFHRHFAVEMNSIHFMNLLHKDRVVGTITFKGSIHLFDTPDASFIGRILAREGF